MGDSPEKDSEEDNLDLKTNKEQNKETEKKRQE